LISMNVILKCINIVEKNVVLPLKLQPPASSRFS